ncbi:hypothetical protein U9M48_019736 [Paspalum notatum var. saurae]|uniref:Cullin N-terminal domain-containing protein n=1 Tax=Paspalum notatum var. saurae TaxID=547442 RepID=A0AAQ3TDB4_PASNO
MCTQKPPHDYSQMLYDMYKADLLDVYITSTVLPSLMEKHGEFLLRELVLRWKNHKVMVRWLSRFFDYLDRFFVSRRSLDPLSTVGWNSFKTLIDEDREGQIIDHTLVKNVLDIYIELGCGPRTVESPYDSEPELYQVDFEDGFRKGTRDYYFKKTQTWIVEDSCPEYMVKRSAYKKRENEFTFFYRTEVDGGCTKRIARYAHRPNSEGELWMQSIAL